MHQSKIRFECVIECQIYYVNECGTKCEIVHQSKTRFECEIECKIYYVNKCGTNCEIVHQKKIWICNLMPIILCKWMWNKMWNWTSK